MKTKYRVPKLLLFLLGILILASCGENEKELFDDKDAFFSFDIDNVKVMENNTNTLEIPVYIAHSRPVGTLKYVIDTEGIERPAVEGVDFNIISDKNTVNFNGDNFESISIEIIDNDLTDRTKQFKLVLVNEGSSFQVGMAGNVGVSCLITIGDNEHYFSSLLGTYSVYETTIEPAEYRYNVTVSGHDDPYKLIVTGLWGVQQDLVMQLDPDSDELYILPDQQFYNIADFGFGVVDLLVRAWHYNDQNELVRTPTVYGTYDKENGIIELPDGYIVDFSRADDPNIIGKSIEGMKQDYCIMTKN